MPSTRRTVLAVGTLLVGAFPLFAQSPANGSEDAALNRAAYAALLRVEDLSDRNIGVRVYKDGTAVLWGSATPADAARAEAVVRAVPGVTRVVNVCEPVSVTDPLVERVDRAFKGKPESAPAPPAGPVIRPTRAEQRPGEPTIVPAARLAEPVVPHGPIDYAGVERIRKSDPRYGRLTFDLRDGRVVVSAPAGDAGAAWDLAQRIAPLVGNRDVVIARVR